MHLNTANIVILADQLEYAVTNWQGRTTMTAQDVTTLRAAIRKMQEAETTIARKDKLIHDLLTQRAKLRDQVEKQEARGKALLKSLTD